MTAREDIVNYKAYVENVLYHHPESIKNVLTQAAGRIAENAYTTADVTAIRSAETASKFDILEKQVAELREIIGRTFNIGTPQAQQDPLQAAASDPWQ